MSGRVRVTLPDGRRVVGYRKTLRRQSPRTPTWEKPELRLAFILPPTLAFAVRPDTYGYVQVGPLANVTVTAKTFNKTDVFQRAAAFLRTVTPEGHMPYTVAVNLTSSSEPGWVDHWRISYLDGHVAAAKTPVDLLLFPAAA